MYIYFQLGNLDPALRSRLESINLIALFHHEELSSYSLDEQLPQDLMHLLFEGLFPFHIRVLFKRVVISEVVLNARVFAYPYAYFDAKPARIYTFEFTSGSQTGEELFVYKN